MKEQGYHNLSVFRIPKKNINKKTALLRRFTKQKKKLLYVNSLGNHPAFKLRGNSVNPLAYSVKMNDGVNIGKIISSHNLSR